MTSNYEKAERDNSIVLALLAIADAIQESSAPVQIDMSNLVDAFGLRLDEEED